jgi:DNA-binding MarR family transcriptional regulator
MNGTTRLPMKDMQGPRQKDHTDFRRMPGYLLRRCHQIGVAIFLDGCKKLELTPLQFGSLAALDRFGPMDQVNLGGVMALDRTTILVVLSKLERCGLIERQPSENDKRSRITSITEAGRSLLSKARPLVDDVQDRILSPLTARERSRLVELLAKVAEGNNDESRAPYRRPR